MAVSFYDALYSVTIYFVLMVLNENIRVFREHIPPGRWEAVRPGNLGTVDGSRKMSCSESTSEVAINN